MGGYRFRTSPSPTTGAGSREPTLGYLLARLYDVGAGEIRYDGVDVRDLSFQSLTDMLGLVTHEPYLLYASVADNLRFAKPEATNEELVSAARIAQMHDTLSALPDGYDTLVGERGYRFSDGEKQRLALARTILRNPWFCYSMKQQAPSTHGRSGTWQRRSRSCRRDVRQSP